MNRKEAEKALMNMAGIPNERIILMSKFSPVPYAEKLIEKFVFIYDKYKRFWRYDSETGMYKEDAEQFIRNKLRTELFGDEEQKRNYTSEVVEYIKDKYYNPKFEGILQENLIPFRNCLYDIDKGEYVDFSPDYFVTNKIPVDIDSKYVECNIIDAFFDGIVNCEMKQTLYEIAAYCMYRGQPYQKLFFLFGAGKNGKTTYLEMLREFLGQDNVSSISPHKICGSNRFALGQIWNKYANISSDISYEVLNQVNKIKEITGGDTISIERKFKDSFPAKLYAKQIYSTNQLPIVNDNTDAWYRRIYLVEFPNKIIRPDREILKKLIIPEQLSGFAWKCVKLLKEMKDRGFIFTYDIDEEKIRQMYEDLSNPLKKFIRESCEEDIGGYIWKFEFRQRFEDWCLKNKLRVWNDTDLGLQMKKEYEEEKKTYPLAVDKRYWVWTGLKWNVQTVSTVHPFIISSIYMKVSSIPLDKQDSLDTNEVYKP